jgi:hypothetical protein
MPLTIRPTGLSSPVDEDRQDFTVYCGRWAMGRIYQERGGPDCMRWFWSVYVRTRSERLAYRLSPQLWETRVPFVAGHCPFRGLADQRNSGDRLLRGGVRRNRPGRTGWVKVKGARVVITSALRRWTLSPRGQELRGGGAVCPLADLQRKGPGLRRGQG